MDTDLIQGARYVAISGRKGSGKTLLADYLGTTRQYQRISFGTPIKICMAVALGFRAEQLYSETLKEEVDERLGISPREAMQKFGTELMREQLPLLLPNMTVDPDAPSIWCRCMKACFQRQTQGQPHVRIVVDDLRFPDEELTLRKLGFLIVKVRRPAAALSLTGAHSSETSMDLIKEDVCIQNAGQSLDEYVTAIEKVLRDRLPPIAPPVDQSVEHLVSEWIQKRSKKQDEKKPDEEELLRRHFPTQHTLDMYVNVAKYLT